MNGRGKSDRPVVPAKPSNNAGLPAAEAVEERGLGKGNVASNTRPGPRAGQDAPSALDRVRRVARQDKEARFTALLHHVDIDRLRAAYWALKPRAAPGVDGVTWADYGQDLEANLRDLHSRVHRGGYRARPSRRVYIPKADGRQRPLGVAALEDKLLQRAVVEVLNTIYGKRRTTGMEKGMEESYVEDLASHGDPESCVGDPRGRSEALTGVRAGRPLSPEMRSTGVPTRSYSRKATPLTALFASRQRTPRGLRTRHVCDLFMLRTGRSHDHPLVVMEGRVARGRLRP